MTDERWHMLHEYWLAHIRRMVRRAKESSGLTTTEIAERCGKNVRWARGVERADCTIGGLADYLLACGYLICDLELLRWDEAAMRFVEETP